MAVGKKAAIIFIIVAGGDMADVQIFGQRRLQVGRMGEDLALRFLEERGMRLVARNWRSGHKELDLIVDDGKFLRIVEVKSLVYPNGTDPFGAVDTKKRRRMVAAANHFVLHHDVRQEVVFDVVSVVFNGDHYKLEYFEEAFSPCCI